MRDEQVEDGPDEEEIAGGHSHCSKCGCCDRMDDGRCPECVRLESGAELIRRERERQLAVEGWMPEQDDAHDRGELAVAAACYATEATYAVAVLDISRSRDAWPWERTFDKRKKHSRLRQLVIAGALIAAEIDRLNRLGA